MKFNMISIEGIDRSGKGTLFKHLQWLGNHEHIILDRGPLSNYVFSKMFDRGFKYDISNFSNIIFVFLDIDYDDWVVRCNVTREPQINFKEHYKAYEDAIVDFQQNGCTFLRYNTSHIAIHQIALDILLKYKQLASTSV